MAQMDVLREEVAGSIQEYSRPTKEARNCEDEAAWSRRGGWQATG